MIDFTYPFCQFYYVMAMKKPGLRERKWFTILYIIQWSVLVTIAACSLCIVIFIYLSERYSSRRNQANPTEYHSSRRNQVNLWMNIAMHVYGTLIMQSKSYLFEHDDANTLLPINCRVVAAVKTIINCFCIFS